MAPSTPFLGVGAAFFPRAAAPIFFVSDFFFLTSILYHTLYGLSTTFYKKLLFFSKKFPRKTKVLRGTGRSTTYVPAKQILFCS